jgi:carbonic anhydrase/acetyltransferase-like protein (isoleucine patch superfamily)
MEITNALKRLRDDLKEWTTNNILSLKTYVDKTRFSGSYNDLTNKPEIPSIEGLATEQFVNNAINNIPEEFSGDYNDLTNKPEIPTVTNDLTDELKANYDTAYERSESGEMKMYCIDGFSGSLLAAHAPSQDRGNAVFYSTKAYITSSGSIGTDGNINAKAFYEDGIALENKYVTDESLSAVAKKYLPLTGGLVTGNVQIDGNLVNNNDATFNKQVTFNDMATLGAGANLAGNAVHINADGLVNNSPSTHNNTATFNGEITFNKSVTFGEDAVLSGNKVQIDANTLVNNAVSTHNQAATFNGNATFNSPTTLGAGANLAGNEVQINSNTLVNNAVSTHNQDTTFNGETTFNSPTTLGAGANLAGNEVQINANTLVNNSPSTHNQAATFNNTVIFNEQATFSKDLNVAGNVNVTAETGDAWFNGNVSVGADNKQLATEEFVNTMLDGLRLMQITREAYDALETKDPSTLYIII